MSVMTLHSEFRAFGPASRALPESIFLVLAALLVLVQPPPTASRTLDCTTVVEGIDTTFARNSRSPFHGRALGQVFRANDTLLTRLVVWRWPSPSNVGVHLFITTVDSNAVPPRPRAVFRDGVQTLDILLDGPTLTINGPPPQLIELPFVIDPPLALPQPGLYAFFLQAEGCNEAAVWDIMASEHNPYPDGIYWITAGVTPGCWLRAVDGGEDSTDLIFKAEFCRTRSTPTSRSTWGTIKTRYH